MNIFDSMMDSQQLTQDPGPLGRPAGWGMGPQQTTPAVAAAPNVPMQYNVNLNQQQTQGPLSINYPTNTEDILGSLSASYGQNFTDSSAFALSTEIQDSLNELKKVTPKKNMTAWDKFSKVMNTAYENLMKPETYPLIKMFFAARNGGQIQDVFLAGADASMKVKQAMFDNAYKQAQMNNFQSPEERAADLAYKESITLTPKEREMKALTAKKNIDLIDSKIEYYKTQATKGDTSKLIKAQIDLANLSSKKQKAFNEEIAAMTPEGIGKIDNDILDISTRLVSSYDLEGNEAQLTSDIATYATILFNNAGKTGQPITQSQAVHQAVNSAFMIEDGPLSGTGIGWGTATYDPTQLTLPSTDVITVSLSAIMQQPEYAGMSREEIMKQAAANPSINLVQ